MQSNVQMCMLMLLPPFILCDVGDNDEISEKIPILLLD